MSDWRRALLKTMGYRPTPQNLKFLDTWQRWEGGHTNNSARWNWLNTTHGEGRSINSVGVKAFRNFNEGIANTVATLNNGRYQDILRALASGDPYAAAPSAGLQVWVSGKEDGNPKYAQKILGGRAATPLPARAARAARQYRDKVSTVVTSPNPEWDRAMQLIWDDDPEMAELMAQMDDRTAVRSGIVSKGGSLRPVEDFTPGKGIGSGLGAKVAKIAQTQLGKPYVFGSGPGTDSFDCSDLIQWAYKQMGIHIPRTTGEMQAALPTKAWKDIQPGDLVMKTTPGGTNEGGHVVMYIGNGKVIAAPYTGTVVQIQPLSKFQGGNYHIRYVPRKGKR